MQVFQQKMDTIGDNIANVDTTAFKAGRVEVADNFSQTLKSATSGSTGIQIGNGAATASISTNFADGSLAETGNPDDLAITGNGFFIVRDPASGTQYATRAGNFKVANGYLQTQDGMRVQGFTDTTLTTRGDIKIDETDDGTTPHAFYDEGKTLPVKMDNYTIDESGIINVTLANGTATFRRGQVLLQAFDNPQALVREGNNLYSGLGTASPRGGSVLPTAPKANGLGSISEGKLEMSTVDLTTEMADLITTQRAFQASARIITTSDEFMQEIVNLKR